MTYRIFGIALVFFSLSGHSAPKDITMVYEGDFTASQKSFAEKAAHIVFERIAENRVAQCAYRHSFREKSKQKLRKLWSSQITMLNKNPKARLTIAKKSLKPNHYGEAKVGIAKIDRDRYRIENLAITLNEDTLNQDVEAYSKRSSSDRDIDIWVSTIAHEIGHNLGYRHGSTGDWIIDYPGYFVTELGFCVMTNGKYGSDLGDLNRRRKYEKAAKGI